MALGTYQGSVCYPLENFEIKPNSPSIRSKVLDHPSIIICMLSELLKGFFATHLANRQNLDQVNRVYEYYSEICECYVNPLFIPSIMYD